MFLGSWGLSSFDAREGDPALRPRDLLVLAYKAERATRNLLGILLPGRNENLDVLFQFARAARFLIWSELFEALELCPSYLEGSTRYDGSFSLEDRHGISSDNTPNIVVGKTVVAVRSSVTPYNGFDEGGWIK
jgi:hypothetical protein